MGTAAVTQQANQQNANVNVMAANEQARRLLVRRSVEMTQEIYSNSVNAANTQIINIVPRNVGVVKRFIVQLSGTVTNNDTSAPAYLLPIGLASLISNVTFYDLQNNMRINTTGEHLYMLSSVKRQRFFMSSMGFQPTSSYTPNFLPSPGSIWGMVNDPTFTANLTLDSGQSAPVRMFWEIPLAYSDDDLRGSVFANVVNTTMNLQITLNSQLVTTADTHNAMYLAATTSTGPSVTLDQATITVYQVYLDQLPSAANGQLILPNIDLATVYQITNTTLTGVTPNQDFPIPFANFRDFFSVLLYYWPGTDVFSSSSIVNSFSLTTANFTNIYRYDGYFARALMRDITRHELPANWYYFSSRRHPIWTTQFGNQSLNMSANVAEPGAYLFVMWEQMALQNTLVGSASLPAG